MKMFASQLLDGYDGNVHVFFCFAFVFFLQIWWIGLFVQVSNLIKFRLRSVINWNFVELIKVETINRDESIIEIILN